MLSILTNIEYQMANSDVSNVNEIRRIVADVKSELRVLAGVVCSSWLKLLMGRINKLVIPAVVESQTLPGFVCNLQTSGGFFGKLMGGDKSNINVDTILSFLTKLWKIINFYYLDAEIGRNIILEILDNIGMTSFNHLLVRKNFCSWKRGNFISKGYLFSVIRHANTIQRHPNRGMVQSSGNSTIVPQLGASNASS